MTLCAGLAQANVWIDENFDDTIPFGPPNTGVPGPLEGLDIYSFNPLGFPAAVLHTGSMSAARAYVGNISYRLDPGEMVDMLVPYTDQANGDYQYLQMAVSVETIPPPGLMARLELDGFDGAMVPYQLFVEFVSDGVTVTLMAGEDMQGLAPGAPIGVLDGTNWVYLTIQLCKTPGSNDVGDFPDQGPLPYGANFFASTPFPLLPLPFPAQVAGGTTDGWRLMQFVGTLYIDDVYFEGGMDQDQAWGMGGPRALRPFDNPITVVTQSQNITGHWDFNGDLTATIGLDCLDGSGGLLAFDNTDTVGGGLVESLFFANLPGDGQGLLVPHGLPPNGDGIRSNEYTILMDIKWTDLPTGWAVVTADPATALDSLWFQTSNTGGWYAYGNNGQYSWGDDGLGDVNNWRRVVVTADNGIESIYIDGDQSWIAAGYLSALPVDGGSDGDLSWSPGGLSVFFTDVYTGGWAGIYPASGLVNTLQIRDYVMSPAEIAAFGAATPYGISPSIVPQNITGHWDFNGDLTATIGLDAVDGTAGLLTTYDNTETILGATAHSLTFANLPGAGAGLLVPHGVAANGDGARSNEYTILMDLKLTGLRGGWAILTADQNDSLWFQSYETGGWYAYGNNSIYSWGADGFGDLNNWRRVVITSDDGLTSIYIDGDQSWIDPAYLSALPLDGTDGDLSWTPGGSTVFFADNYSAGNPYVGAYCATGLINSLQIRDYVMTPAEIAAFGPATAEGINPLFTPTPTPTPLVPGDHYVTPNGNPSGGGAWSVGTETLVAASAAVAADRTGRIFMLQGTYDVNQIEFAWEQRGLEIYGGFDGTDSTFPDGVAPVRAAGWTQNTNPTVLEGNGWARGLSCWNSDPTIDTATPFVFEGLIFQNFKNWWWADIGALRVVGFVDVTVSYCTFQGNRSEYNTGGTASALYVETSGDPLQGSASLTIDHCLFDDNKGADRGNALYFVSQLPPGTTTPGTLDITNTSFTNNGDNVNGWCVGGAVFIDWSYGGTIITIEDSLFDNNEARNDGGAIFVGDLGGGGPGVVDAGTVFVTRCQFTNNKAAMLNGGQAGGIKGWAKAGMLIATDCLFAYNEASWGDQWAGTGAAAIRWDDQMVLVNCVFTHNEGQGESAVAAWGDPGGGPADTSILINCTFVDNGHNVAGLGTVGGVPNGGPWATMWCRDLTMINCLFDDTEWVGGGSVVDSNSMYNTTPIWGVPDATSIIDGVSGFYNVAADDFRLTALSEAIDAGAVSALGATAPLVDYRGVSRDAAPDMGAFEFALPAIVSTIPAAGQVSIGELFNVTVTFNQEVIGVVEGDLSLTGAAGAVVADLVSSVDGITYEFTLSSWVDPPSADTITAALTSSSITSTDLLAFAGDSWIYTFASIEPASAGTWMLYE